MKNKLASQFGTTAATSATAAAVGIGVVTLKRFLEGETVYSKTIANLQEFVANV